jgi:hypothetical protein
MIVFVSVYLTIAGICAIVGVVATGLFTICAGNSLCLICNNVLVHSFYKVSATLKGPSGQIIQIGLKMITYLD